MKRLILVLFITISRAHTKIIKLNYYHTLLIELLLTEREIESESNRQSL